MKIKTWNHKIISIRLKYLNQYNSKQIIYIETI